MPVNADVVSSNSAMIVQSVDAGLESFRVEIVDRKPHEPNHISSRSLDGQVREVFVAPPGGWVTVHLRTEPDIKRFSNILQGTIASINIQTTVVRVGNVYETIILAGCRHIQSIGAANHGLSAVHKLTYDEQLTQ